MASYVVQQDQPLVIDVPYDHSIQGWTVSQNIAYHSGCNPGYIKSNPAMDLSNNTNWTFRYTIQSIEAGTVNIVVDGQVGISRSVAGTYEETFVSSNPNAIIQFYATGISSVSQLQVFSNAENNGGRTLAFNEDANRWITDFSYVGEFMNKFINGFYVFHNGELWEQNVNPIRNNFFGIQYSSIIEFIINIQPTAVKNMYTIRLVGSKPWSIDITIPPREGKSMGQKSRLKLNRFRRLQGMWFADFLKDILDPRFNNEIDALMKGADLQGATATIRMEINSTEEIRLVSVDTELSVSEYSY